MPAVSNNSISLCSERMNGQVGQRVSKAQAYRIVGGRLVEDGSIGVRPLDSVCG